MKTILFTTILFSGLVSGLLYGYACSVNIGFRSLSDAEYIRAMQSINQAIQNPVFFITFLGLVVLFPLTTYQMYYQKSPAFNLFLTAAAIYILGVFGITILFNVPLNDHLAKFSTQSASLNELSAMRQNFAKSWNMFHMIRTIASIAAFGLALWSAFKFRFE